MRGHFFAHIAVRDKAVDGIPDGGRMSPPIGKAGLTGITKLSVTTDLQGAPKGAPFQFRGRQTITTGNTK